MDPVELLTEARTAGLRVTERGDLLEIRGPVRLESLALRLLHAKAEILVVLRWEQEIVLRPCNLCNSRVFWRYARGPFVCSICHPCPCPEKVFEEIRLAGAIPSETAKMLEEHGWEEMPLRWPQARGRCRNDAHADESDWCQ